jgi:hypothetical protein
MQWLKSFLKEVGIEGKATMVTFDDFARARDKLWPGLYDMLPLAKSRSF